MKSMINGVFAILDVVVLGCLQGFRSLWAKPNATSELRKWNEVDEWFSLMDFYYLLIICSINTNVSEIEFILFNLITWSTIYREWDVLTAWVWEETYNKYVCTAWVYLDYWLSSCMCVKDCVTTSLSLWACMSAQKSVNE